MTLDHRIIVSYTRQIWAFLALLALICIPIAGLTFFEGMYQKPQVAFFPVTVFGKTGEAAAKYVTKGRQVLVDGRIQVNDKKYFNIIADRVQFGAEPLAANKEKESE